LCARRFVRKLTRSDRAGILRAIQAGTGSCGSAAKIKMNAKTYSKLLILTSCGLMLTGMLCVEAADTKAKPNVTQGPATVSLGSVAKVELPEGYVFLDGETYRALLKADGEPVNGHELGLMRATNAHWSVVFEFADTGYVKDDEKDKLNADKMLAAIKRGNDAANKERVRAGNPPIQVVGWDIPPRYDATTHNLEWAIRGAVEGQPILNYNTRLLGRKGVMEVVLVVDPEQLAETLPRFRELLTGYSFQTGQTYAEYRPGDKIAKYGLGALVVGGAAVGAAKLGAFAWLAVFFKKGFKLIIIAFVAAVAFLRKIVGKVFGRGNDPRQQ
jgi:uncharacterized membrane-anchored protein